MKHLTNDDRARMLDLRIAACEESLTRHREIMSSFSGSNDLDASTRQASKFAVELGELKAARQAVRGD